MPQSPSTSPNQQSLQDSQITNPYRRGWRFGPIHPSQTPTTFRLSSICLESPEVLQITPKFQIHRYISKRLQIHLYPHVLPSQKYLPWVAWTTSETRPSPTVVGLGRRSGTVAIGQLQATGQRCKNSSWMICVTYQGELAREKGNGCGATTGGHGDDRGWENGKGVIKECW